VLYMLDMFYRFHPPQSQSLKIPSTGGFFYFFRTFLGWNAEAAPIHTLSPWRSKSGDDAAAMGYAQRAGGLASIGDGNRVGPRRPAVGCRRRPAGSTETQKAPRLFDEIRDEQHGLPAIGLQHWPQESGGVLPFRRLSPITEVTLCARPPPGRDWTSHSEYRPDVLRAWMQRLYITHRGFDSGGESGGTRRAWTCLAIFRFPLQQRGCSVPSLGDRARRRWAQRRGSRRQSSHQRKENWLLKIP